MMKLSEIQKIAKRLGIKDSWNFKKKDLIKSIQKKEGNFDCFGTATSYCDQFSCLWRSDCLRVK